MESAGTRHSDWVVAEETYPTPAAKSIKYKTHSLATKEKPAEAGRLPQASARR